MQKHYEGERRIDTDAFFFFVNQIIGFTEIVFCCATREDEVFCNFTYTEPLYPKEHIERFIQNFVTIMQKNILDFQLIPSWNDDAIKQNSKMAISKSLLFSPLPGGSSSIWDEPRSETPSLKK